MQTKIKERTLQETLFSIKEVKRKGLEQLQVKQAHTEVPINKLNGLEKLRRGT